MSVTLLDWFAAQQQTSTFKRQKIRFFTQNLVQNQMSLFLASKSNREWKKQNKALKT